MVSISSGIKDTKRRNGSEIIIMFVLNTPEGVVFWWKIADEVIPVFSFYVAWAVAILTNIEVGDVTFRQLRKNRDLTLSTYAIFDQNGLKGE